MIKNISESRQCQEMYFFISHINVAWKLNDLFIFLYVEA